MPPAGGSGIRKLRLVLEATHQGAQRTPRRHAYTRAQRTKLGRRRRAAPQFSSPRAPLSTAMCRLHRNSESSQSGPPGTDPLRPRRATSMRRHRALKTRRPPRWWPWVGVPTLQRVVGVVDARVPLAVERRWAARGSADASRSPPLLARWRSGAQHAEASIWGLRLAREVSVLRSRFGAHLCADRVFRDAISLVVMPLSRGVRRGPR